MSINCQNTKAKLDNPFIDDYILMEDNFIEGDKDGPEPNDKDKIIIKHIYIIEEKLFFVKLMENKSQHICS